MDNNNTEIAQTVLGALNRLDVKFDTRFDNINLRFDGVKEALEDLRADNAVLSERVANVESRQESSQREADRWWSQTWPNHEKVIESLEGRLRSAEQTRATQQKIDDLETRLRDVENVKSSVARIGTLETEVNVLKEFKASATVKLALLLSGSSFIGAGVVTVLLKVIFHL